MKKTLIGSALVAMLLLLATGLPTGGQPTVAPTPVILYGAFTADANATRLATDYILSASYRMTIDGTSRTLADPNVVSAGAVSLTTIRLAILPEAGTDGVPTDLIRYQLGATATTSSPLCPAGGMVLPIKHGDANVMRVRSDGGSTMYATLQVYTPR